MRPPTASDGPTKVWLSWSSGKDAAYSLLRLRADPTVEVTGLLTTVTEEFDRVSMHGVREELLRAQAERVGLPLHLVEIPYPCPNARYEQLLGAALHRARREGVGQVAFGDLFLEDVRRYRETLLAREELRGLYPLWGVPTRALIHEMLDHGLRAVVMCVDPRRLAPSFAGREIDRRFLENLPPGVDPCGENGEFHTFVRDGPMFDRPIPVRSGATVERDGFVFADLLPA